MMEYAIDKLEDLGLRKLAIMNIEKDEEIERLQEELDKTRLSELDKEYRIDKAIEYINEMTLTSDGYANYGDDLRPEHIIEILKGSDKE